MPINNDKEKVNEIVSRNWKLGDEVGLAVEIHSFLLEAEARERTEAVEDHITELKQCPQCFTMKSFSTAVCFRCLDRKEAMREAKAELREKIESKTNELVLNYGKKNEERIKFVYLSDIITLLEEEK